MLTAPNPDLESFLKYSMPLLEEGWMDWNATNKKDR
jgi:hypothetical protein